MPPPAAFTYVPLGAGPRNCIGGAYGVFETEVILARLLQQFEFQLARPRIQAHMGATLEPRPGVMMTARRRSRAGEQSTPK